MLGRHNGVIALFMNDDNYPKQTHRHKKILEELNEDIIPNDVNYY